MIVLDTDILIDVQRGHLPAIEWIESLSEIPSITGFTALELVQDARDKTEVDRALKLVDPLPIFWPSVADCDAAVTCYSALHLSHRLGLLDVLIAFTAIGLNAQLCTYNLKHFRPIPNLKTIQPYSR